MAKKSFPLTWASVKKLVASSPPARSPATISWVATQRLIDAAYEDALPRAEMLRSEISQSTSRLRGIGEPLLLDLGLHRRLDKAREESYSDWLAWTLDQLGTAGSVFHALGIEKHQALERCGQHCSVSSREVCIQEGHEGHAGRVDILVQFGTAAALVVEVKLGPPADPMQLAGYHKSMATIPGACEPGVLIAVAEDSNAAPHGFVTRSWAGVCKRLRWLVADLLTKNCHPLKAALMLAFLSAVEQNIVGLPAHALRAISRGQPVQVSPTMAERLMAHLRASSNWDSGGLMK